MSETRPEAMRVKNLIEKHFKESGLCADYLNAWSSVLLAINEKDVAHLKPIPTYDEYFLEQAEQYQNDCPDYFDLINERTNSVSRQQSNTLVGKYNDNLEKIKEDHDFNLVRNFYAAMYKLVFSSDCPII